MSTETKAKSNVLPLLFITQEYSPISAGGAGVYAYELTKALAAHGTSVHTIAPGDKTYDETINEYHTIHRFKVINLPLFRVPSFYLQIIFRTKKIIADNAIRSIHSNNNAGVCVPSKLPFISTFHHPAIDEFKNASWFRRMIYLPDLIFEKIILSRANIIIPISHIVEASLGGRVPQDKINRIPDGIDTTLFKPSSSQPLRKELDIQPNEVMLFFPGGARAKRKGGLDLVAALEKLKDLEFRCIISGVSRETGWKGELDEAIHKAGLKNKFIWVNEIDYARLPNYYSVADIVVYPSTFEGFGLPVLEALACNKPLICSNTGEAPYIIQNGENGIIIDVHDVKKLTEALKVLITDQATRDNLAFNAHKHIMSYTWDSVAKEIILLHEATTKVINNVA